MFWKMKCRVNPLSRQPQVVPIHCPESPLPSDIASWVLSMLRAQGSMAPSDLVQRVAHRLYHDALRHGAASVDIGLFGERLFDCEAAAVVESGDGVWWTIGKSEPTAAFVADDAVRRADRSNSESGSEQ